MKATITTLAGATRTACDQTEGQKKETPPTYQANGVPETTRSYFTTHSTATEAQYERVILALREGPQTTEQLRQLGVYCPAPRIKELKDNYGFDIRKDPIDLYDVHGYRHAGVARYYLDAEPPEGFTPLPENDASKLLRDAANSLRAHSRGLKKGTVRAEDLPKAINQLLDSLRLLNDLQEGGAA